MSDIKINCNKCDAKFFVLNRDKITCTKCNNTIIVKEIEKNIQKNVNVEEPIEDVLLPEEELDFSDSD